MKFPTEQVMSFVTGRSLVTMNEMDYVRIACAFDPRIKPMELEGVHHSRGWFLKSTYDLVRSTVDRFDKDLEIYERMVAGNVTMENINNFIDLMKKRHGDEITITPITMADR